MLIIKSNSPIYSIAFLGEKLTKVKLVSLVLVIAGSTLVSGIIGNFTYSAKGIIFGFAAAITYSAYNILTKIEMKNKCNPISASMYSFVFMMIVSLFFSKPAEIFNIALSDYMSAICMIFCGLCTCVIPYFLYTLSLRSLDVGTAASLGIVEPMAATLFSIILLGERINVYSFTGIVLILLAVLLISRNSVNE